MNTFGTPQPAFSFGAPQQPQSSTLFGAPSQPLQQQPAFNFGTTQPQQQSQTLFGTQQQPQSVFGTAQQPQPPTLFGAPQQPVSGFGAPQQLQSSTLFGPKSTQPTAFNFGTTQQPQSSNIFGTTSQQPAFNFVTSQPQTSNLFGTQQQPPTFNFGTPQQTQASTMFGTKPVEQSVFNFVSSQQPQTLLATQAQQEQPYTSCYESVFQCSKFGDERDFILANFNYLQACFGTGKGYYSQTHPPVIYTPANPFYRCKAVGYSFMHTNSNEDGLVSFEMKKSTEKIQSEEKALTATLQSFLNRPNIIFKIAGVKGMFEEQSLVNVYCEDVTSLRRIPATDLAGAIAQPHLKIQLDTWGISNVSAKVKPSPEQLKRYLENAPEGIDPRVWKQAQEDNPDPEIMIPCPIIGTDALKNRVHIQETESEHHGARVSLLHEECNFFQNRCSNVGAEIIQLKRKQAQLSHRLLMVIGRLEIARKGVSNFQTEEVNLVRRLHTIEDDLNSPTEYKGRLKELLSHLRLQQFSGPSAKYTIDETSLHDIKEFLTIQQKSLQHLVQTVKGDLENLSLITDTANDPKVKVHKETYQAAGIE